MISGYHPDKLEIEFDIGALIDAAVRSGFDDEDEPESAIEPYTSQHGSVQVEIESIKKTPSIGSILTTILVCRRSQSPSS